jgi:tRNA pseudouridine13 synthase
MRYLTEDLPGTGGHIKERPEDFRVTELPLYEPSGEGTHVYLLVEKTGLGSLEAAEKIARALGKARHVVGIAGLKDAQAVTRQWMSLERVDPEKAAALKIEGIRIVAVSRHRNKLKIGHLAGNRFEIRIRGCRPGARAAAERVLGVLQARGVPNWFDYQRFGRRGDNHVLGRALVLGRYVEFCDRFLGHPTEGDSRRIAEARRRYDAGDLEEAHKLMSGQTDHLRVLTTLLHAGDPERAARNLPRQLAKLFIGAYQSWIFNQVLERRLGSFDSVEAGDLAYIHRPGGHGGAVFLVEDAAAEAPRAARFEISPSGPIVGHRVTLASGRPGETERAVLAEEGISPDDFERVKALRLRGDRRPLRFPLTDAQIAAEGADLVVSFQLPSGAYATVVLAEITKTPGT